MQSFSYMWTDELGEAIKAANNEPYPMSLVSDDAKAVIEAVNQGIDAHLEACFIPDRGDSFETIGNRLECSVSPESLPVLIRRLLENGDETGIASDICQTLDIELI